MSSHLKGPSEGDWSVFAEKVVEERDALRAEVRDLKARLRQSLSVSKAMREKNAIIDDLKARLREAKATTLDPYPALVPRIRRITDLRRKNWREP